MTWYVAPSGAILTLHTNDRIGNRRVNSLRLQASDKRYFPEANSMDFDFPAT